MEGSLGSAAATGAIGSMAIEATEMETTRNQRSSFVSDSDAQSDASKALISTVAMSRSVCSRACLAAIAKQKQL